MNIIKQGVVPPEQNYEVTCGNCDTEFEFVESEGRWVCGSGEESTLSVECPLCGKFLGLTVKHSEATHEQTTKTD